MINAGSGITPSDLDGPPPSGYYSLGVSEALIDAIDLYEDVTVVQRYRSLYDSGRRQSLMLGAARISFDALAFDQCPALVNRAPYKKSDGSSPYPGIPINSSIGNAGPPEWRTPYSPGIRWMTEFILTNARLIMGYLDPEDLNDQERDLTKFAQIQGICDAYRGQANTMVNSSVNSEIVATTFTGMQDLSTGGVSQVSPSFQQFGGDLVNLGNLINLRTLSYLGYPSNLLRQMLNVGGLLPGVYDALVLAGVTDQNIATVKQPDAEIALDLELKIYRGLILTSGEALAQVLELLDISQTNANDTTLTQPFTFTNAADLLNPAKILPNSYLTLLMQVTGTDGKTQDVKIYSSANTVNSSIEIVFADDEIYNNLKKVIPAAQALANSALIRSLRQIKNITNLEFPEFAVSTAALENNSGLTAVNSLAAPVPPAVQTTVQDTLATGTGENNSLTLYDLIGTAAGWVHTESFIGAADILGTIDTQVLVDLYKITTDTLAGMYTIYYPPVMVPPTPGYWETIVPGSGTYVSLASENDSISQAVSDNTGIGLVPQMVAEVDSIVAGFPQQVEQLNQLWSNMAEQINREAKNRYMAELIFDFGSDTYPDLKPYSRSSALAMISSLHSYGTETSQNGSADFFNAVAQSNLGGQSVIASLREGRNIEALIDAGAGVDTQLPSSPQ